MSCNCVEMSAVMSVFLKPFENCFLEFSFVISVNNLYNQLSLEDKVVGCHARNPGSSHQEGDFFRFVIASLF